MQLALSAVVRLPILDLPQTAARLFGCQICSKCDWHLVVVTHIHAEDFGYRQLVCRFGRTTLTMTSDHSRGVGRAAKGHEYKRGPDQSG